MPSVFYLFNFLLFFSAVPAASRRGHFGIPQWLKFWVCIWSFPPVNSIPVQNKPSLVFSFKHIRYTHISLILSSESSVGQPTHRNLSWITNHQTGYTCHMDWVLAKQPSLPFWLYCTVYCNVSCRLTRGLFCTKRQVTFPNIDTDSCMTKKWGNIPQYWASTNV